jgi:hypothetical protein
MARWRLNEAHYLFGHPPDLDITEWEYKETDRVNGRDRRKRFEVPYYFDVDTIVCHEDRGLPTDSVFRGPPTPAMEPLDDEAKAISAELAPSWVHPIESLPGQGFSASLLGSLEKQLAEVASRLPSAVPVASSGVSREEFAALQAQLAELMAKNAELQAVRL